VTDTKPSNPKDIVGAKKLDLGLVPDTAVAALATAFLEGALKYGRYNWRVAGVSASTYHAALRRHIAKWWNGQDNDPETQVSHLANAMACIAIIFDAEVYGKLTDDRPPAPGYDTTGDRINHYEHVIGHLKRTFAEHSPKQYTIADTQPNPNAVYTVRELAAPPLPVGVKHCGHEGCVRTVVPPAPYCYEHADIDRRPPEPIGTTSGRCLKANCYNNTVNGPYCPAHRPVDL
jgi:hypothetical protein